MSIQRLMGLGILILSVAIGGCAAPGAGEPDTAARDPKEPRTYQHEFHTNQEHYDLPGAVEPKQ